MLLRIITLASLAGAVALTGLTGGFGSAAWVWMLPAWFAGSWVGLLLLAVLFLWLATLAVDTKKPQEEDSPFYRFLVQLYVPALMGLAGVRMKTQGLEQLPKDGRFLLVCNHLHVADPGLLLAAFPRSQLAFISKQENQNLFVVGKLMHKIQCQLIDRDNDRAALKTILKCIQLLKEDKASVAVFPEGYTSKDCKLHHFRSGVFKIAQKAKVPIVVCTVKNSRQILPNLFRFRSTTVPVHLVKVITPEQFQGLTTVQISDMVYETMISDLGEEVRWQES